MTEQKHYRERYIAFTRKACKDRSDCEFHENQEFMQDACTYFIELRAPLLTTRNDITSVIEFAVGETTYRIYPPFLINKDAAKASSFEDAFVPVAHSDCCQAYVRLPDDRVTSVSVGPPAYAAKEVGQTYCHGLRIDVIGEECGVAPGLERFLQATSEKTFQWWIASDINPFDQELRLRAHLLSSYQLPCKLKMEERHNRHKALVSPWEACTEFQFPLGFEKSIDSTIWRNIQLHLATSASTEIALQNFFSGVSEYMNNRDERSILSLSICFEIFENKHRAARGKNKNASIKVMLNESKVIPSEINSVLRDLILIDRGHVAHGNQPPRLSGGVRTMEQYVKAIFAYISSYYDRSNT